MKNSGIFHISAQNIDCGYSLEPPRQTALDMTPLGWLGRKTSTQTNHLGKAVLASTHNLCFWAEIKSMYTPVHPNFTV